MIQINVRDETSKLKSVVLGTALQMGGVPSLEEAYDPKSKEHIRKGTFPDEMDLIQEMEGFREVLEKHGVRVYRPEIINNCNQIFSRDIGFVIDDKFVRARVIDKRKEEVTGISYILDDIGEKNVILTPSGVRIEGGDVMPWNDHIFVGYSKEEDFNKYVVARTNENGVEFLKDNFPNRKVKAFELNKSDSEPRDNALHLDCCFQPVGKNKAITYKGGFKNEEDYDFLIDYFGKENVIEITREEMYEMNSNVFSISPDIVVSERNFTRLNSALRDWGFTVEEIKYSETSKMEGLLRCSTLPLIRE